MTRGDILVLGIIIGATGLYWSYKLWLRWLRKRRFVEAKRSEKQAANLLEQKGFNIIRYQPTAASLAYVNGKAHTTTIRADFLARKGWRTYVVEVKSGRTAGRLNARTRRQLLEYQFAFQPDRILLVDMNNKSFKQVSFRPPVHWHKVVQAVAVFVIAFILGGTMIYILGKGTWQ